MILSDRSLKVFFLTLVAYEDDDLIGMLFAFCGLVPFVIFLVLSILFFVERELVYLYSLSGLIVTEVINSILKKLMKQARPESN